jgi:hypothetical protein
VSETTDVLSQAVEEIKMLRHENEILKAKVEVMELFKDALAHPPLQQIKTMRVDPLWAMVKHLDELRQTEKVTGRLSGIGRPGAMNANEGIVSQEEHEAWINQQVADKVREMAMAAVQDHGVEP